VEPKYRPKHNALDLVISPPASDSPFDVYMGTHGPLSISLWKSSASSDMAKSGIEAPAILLDGNRNKLLPRQITSSFPGLIPHILVVVELPKAGDILRLMDAGSSGGTGQRPDAAGRPDPDTTLAVSFDQTQAAAAEQKAKNPDPDINAQEHASMTEIIPPAVDDSAIDADPFTTAETSALADANAVWDGKLDLEIGSAFDGPETTFDPEPSSLMGVGVGIEKIGAALEALSAVPDTFGGGEPATEPDAQFVQAPTQNALGARADTELKLERPGQQDQMAQKGLPLYLVRRADGVGFGLAYSVTVEQGSMDGDKEVRVVRDR